MIYTDPLASVNLILWQRFLSPMAWLKAAINGGLECTDARSARERKADDLQALYKQKLPEIYLRNLGLNALWSCVSS